MPSKILTMLACAALCDSRTGSPAAAAAQFAATYPGVVQHAAKFCKKKHQRFVETGNVDDKPGRGRQQQVTDDDARTAAELLMRGAGNGNPADGFSTLQDAVFRTQHSSQQQQQACVPALLCFFQR
jgi:hypothetical protein